MKKTTIIVLFLFTLGVNAQQKTDKKVAVVSFYTDKIIDVSDLGLNGLVAVTDLIVDLGNNPNFNLTPILEKYHTAFFDSYSKQFPFELLPETTVTQNKDYIDYIPKYDKVGAAKQSIINYTGYKYIHEGILGKVNEEGVAKIFSPIADGTLYTEVHFSLQKGFGIGGNATIKMRATARIALYNKSGEKVFAINEYANSKKTEFMIKGIPVLAPDKILPMCQSALDELMEDLDKRIAKMVKKTEAKL